LSFIFSLSPFIFYTNTSVNLTSGEKEKKRKLENSEDWWKNDDSRKILDRIRVPDNDMGVIY